MMRDTLCGVYILKFELQDRAAVQETGVGQVEADHVSDPGGPAGRGITRAAIRDGMAADCFLFD